MKRANKLFDVANSQNVGAFIVAKNEKHAIAVAREIGHIKNTARAVAQIVDLSDTNLATIVNSGRYGQLAKTVRPMTFDEAISGKTVKQPPAPLFFLKNAK